MSHLRYVTLTGVDESVDFDQLVELDCNYRFVEWGVLYSPDRAGKDPRYPSLDWIEQFVEFATVERLNIALHLCGQAAKDLIQLGNRRLSGVVEGRDSSGMKLLELAQRFGRVQLNTRAKLSDVEALRSLVELVARCENRTRVILQWHKEHEEVCDRLWGCEGFEVLVDGSGGRGLLPPSWPEVNRNFRRIGYAGGLGPDNIAEQLPLIAKAASDRVYCLDMESKLRNSQDQFDLELCRQVLEQVNLFDEKVCFEAGAVYGNQLQSALELKGLWLDWWVGFALDYDMVVPPKNASRAVYLYRPTGKFESFCPSEDDALALRLLHAERVALTPLLPPAPSVQSELGANEESEGPALDEDFCEDEQNAPDTWEAKAISRNQPWAKGSSLTEAGLRAIVVKHLGVALSTNPMAPPPL